jgi:hypothetical protein
MIHPSTFLSRALLADAIFSGVAAVALTLGAGTLVVQLNFASGGPVASRAVTLTGRPRFRGASGSGMGCWAAEGLVSRNSKQATEPSRFNRRAHGIELI